MKNVKLLAPSILSADFLNLQNQIRLTEIGGANLVHCDIMDGIFVPNLTFGPIIVKSVRKTTKLPLDVHLMIEKPENFIAQFINAGAAYITVHQEAVVHLNRVINLIRELGAKPGVALNPATSVSSLEDILPFVDLVLIMSVNPGFGGQEFIEHSLEKIEKLNFLRKKKNLEFLIEVDGGISSANILKISNAGCNIFVAGSSIFESDNISAATTELKNLISNN